MKIELRRSSLWFASLTIHWLFACGALWWFYDIGPLIRDGVFNLGEATSRVIKMGLIVTILTTAAWLWMIRVEQKEKLLRLWWSATWRTLLLLFLYFLAVMFRREMWTQSQGINEDAMFLPIVGHINGFFFSEFRWLGFLIQVIPLMGILSGILFCSQVRLGRRRTLDPPI